MSSGDGNKSGNAVIGIITLGAAAVGAIFGLYAYLNREEPLTQQNTTYQARSNAQGQVECSICLQYAVRPNIRYLPCGHGFHKHCIDAWLNGQGRNCPNCRQ